MSSNTQISDIGNQKSSIKAYPLPPTSQSKKVANVNIGLDVDFIDVKKKKKRQKNLETPQTAKPTLPELQKDDVKDKELPKLVYTYDFLLARAYDLLEEKNPGLLDANRKKFSSKPPQLERVGTKKTRFSNFREICQGFKRNSSHVTDFIFAELGNSGSIDANDQLLMKGRFGIKQIENILRKYVKEYVLCHTCKSPDTELEKEARLSFLQCRVCGSRCSVQNIKTGFQAMTSKRR